MNSQYSFKFALILLPYNTSIILKLKGHIKGRLISRILNFLKNLSSCLKSNGSDVGKGCWGILQKAKGPAPNDSEVQ